MRTLGVLLVLLATMMVVEFAILIEVGRRLGTMETLLLVFGMGIAGAYLARLEGFRVLGKIRVDLDAGRPPARHLLDGLLVLAAGALMILPGLLSDVAGLLLLVPPIRIMVRSWVEHRMRRRLLVTPFHPRF